VKGVLGPDESLGVCPESGESLAVCPKSGESRSVCLESAESGLSREELH